MLVVFVFLKVFEEDMSRFMIVMIKWVVCDKSVIFIEMVKEIGIIIYVVDFDFLKSEFKGLRDYENGYVKEGVGVGGVIWFVIKVGFLFEEVLVKVEEFYRRFMGMKFF